MGINEKRHIVKQFDRELDHVLSLLLTMGSLVQKQLNDALQVFDGSNDALTAKDVIEADKQVNALEVAVDEACVNLIARRQPLANDLRFIITILKVASELERIGDSVDKMSQRVLDDDITFEKSLHDQIDSLGQAAISMLKDTLKAFAEMDLEKAKEIYAKDANIDQGYKEIIQQAKAGMKKNPESVDGLLSAILCARAIERIGDRCQNICEFIYYYLKGKDVREVEGNVF